MDPNQHFCLRWNNHSSTLLNVFETLLADETLVDCTLFAEGRLLKAHKVVLSACSLYFQTLFAQTKDKHPIVILKDVKYKELKILMDYMYRGEISVAQSELGTLLDTADALRIKGLAEGYSNAKTEFLNAQKEAARERDARLSHPAGLNLAKHEEENGDDKQDAQHERESFPILPPASVPSVLSTVLTMPPALSLATSGLVPPIRIPSLNLSTGTDGSSHEDGDSPHVKRRKRMRRKSNETGDSGDSDGRSSGSPGDSMHLPRIPATITPVAPPQQPPPPPTSLASTHPLHNAIREHQLQQQKERERDLEKEIERARGIEREIERARGIEREIDRARGIEREIDRARGIEREIDRARGIEREIDRAREIERARGFEMEIDRARGIEREIERARGLEQDMDREREPEREQERARELERDQERVQERVRTLQEHFRAKSPSPENLVGSSRSAAIDIPRSSPSVRPPSDYEHRTLSPHKALALMAARPDENSSDANHMSDDDYEYKHVADRPPIDQMSDTPGPSTSRPRTEDSHQQPSYLGWPYPPDTSGSNEDSYSALENTNQGLWKSKFLAPYLGSHLAITPRSHHPGMGSPFPGLYVPPPSTSPWGRSQSPPTPTMSVPPLMRGSNECSRCGRLYKTRKGLKHHIKNECGVEPRFQCTHCDWKFKQKAHLLRHIARKHLPS